MTFSPLQFLPPAQMIWVCESAYGKFSVHVCVRRSTQTWVRPQVTDCLIASSLWMLRPPWANNKKPKASTKGPWAFKWPHYETWEALFPTSIETHHSPSCFLSAKACKGSCKDIHVSSSSVVLLQVFLSNEGETENIKIRPVNHLQILIKLTTWYGI